ncbi:MAG: sulfatase-like hydrolase/transferase [Clostridium sp.]|nr:sulfatase-like hydrolase/transferase [Clostridium sp.]
MKARIGLLFRLFVLWMAVFILAKPFFMLYCRMVEVADSAFTLADVADVVCNGFSMDVSTVCYLLIPPFLWTWSTLLVPSLIPRRWLSAYVCVVALLLAVILVVDMSLYPFWKFKLDATVFAYIDSPRQALASVSGGFVVMRVVVMLLLTVALSVVSIRLLPRHSFVHAASKNVLSGGCALFLLIGGLMFLGIRGGVRESTMNVGHAYYCDVPFLNHAAVNPAFSLLSSSLKTDDFAARFNYFEESERESLHVGLYPTTGDLTDTLLVRQRPNVLVLILEGYGGIFIDALGGNPEVSPRINALIRESVFFDNFYANSFRTDRGTLSTLSGHISYPTVTLMKMPAKSALLPSLARSLGRVGYESDFLYGGDVNFTNMKSYLHSMGYSRVTGDKDFTAEERNSSEWGANDSITLSRLYDMIVSRPSGKPWHTAYLSLSSHEPFDVPYHRLSDERENAFAYTDDCVGRFIERLRQTPVWDNLLVVCLPDHSFLHDLSYSDPRFYHVPMFWTGGAIARPRVVHTLMNQSDMAATVLAQLGLPHDDFPYSRNVFSQAYTYPFAYSTYGNGFLFADSTGVTVFDYVSGLPLVEQPSPSAERIRRGQAILQTSYDELATMRLFDR